MGFNNIIAIVGDKFDAINLISSKLVLLRDLDKIIDANLENAPAFLSQAMPNVIILHAKDESEDSLNTIKKIKKTELLGNIPILLYSEDCTKEFLIDAFDCGISDIIKAPVADWELLIRVIWCIQKNETTLNITSRNNFLINLGIIQDKTGFYTEEYAEQFLKNEIDSAVKYKNNACLMLIGPDKKFPPFNSTAPLNETIKKSIRLNDSVGIRKDNKYYIFLPKTKLNGAYAVFERINNNLGLDLGVNASVAEIKAEGFDAIKLMLERTFKNTENNTNTLLVAHDVLSQTDSLREISKTREHDPDIIERRLSIKEKVSQAHNLFKKADNKTDFVNDTFLNSTVPCSSVSPSKFPSLILISVSKTSLIRFADTPALGSIIDIIEIIKNAMMICMVYCRNAMISPTCIIPSSTLCPPTQIVSREMQFIMSIKIGIIKFIALLTNL